MPEKKTIPSERASDPDEDAPIIGLGSLVAPRSEEEFKASFLRKERLVIKTTHPSRATRLLPRWTLDRLITSKFLPSSRLVALREGEVVASHLYRTDEGRPKAGAIEGLIAEGVSFVVNGIDDDVPAVARLCDSLERRLGHTVWVNAYVTHGPGGALAPHYDDHDVIVLQIHGTKRWFGHGAPVPLPVESSPDGVDFGPAKWDELIEPGDVLYLPRGEVHHTSVEGTHAIHLTFGVDTRRGIDLFDALVKRAASDLHFREDLTRLGGEADSVRRERELKERMHALVESADLGVYLRDDDAARPLRSMVHLGNGIVTDRSVVIPAVRRAFELPTDPTDANDLIDLRTGGASFRLSSSAARILAFLVAHDRASLQEIVGHLGGGHDESRARDSVNELVRLGLAGVE